MLTQIRVQNFKSLRDTGDLAIRPLTFLVGPNSSGKSSLLQVLLMLKQTAASRYYDNPLVTYGSYVELGSYKDFIHAHDPSAKLALSLGIEHDGHSLCLECRFGLDPSTQKLVLSTSRIKDSWGDSVDWLYTIQEMGDGTYHGLASGSFRTGHVGYLVNKAGRPDGCPALLTRYTARTAATGPQEVDPSFRTDGHDHLLSSRRTSGR